MFLRKRPEGSVAEFRAWVDETLVPGLAASDDVLKLRRHLFEELDITLDHPGVTMTKPMERQYQAMVEVVVEDEAAFARVVGSDVYRAVATELARQCAAVHPARVRRCITTKHDGRITLAGVRGVAVADLIRKLGATSQAHNDVSREFLPPADLVRS